MNSFSTARQGGRAIVLGGGIAGLAAASVLSSRFEEVTIIERDHYSPEPTVRPHAPQGAHVHILLAGGLHTLTRLVPALPGWFDEMGLHEGDLTHHVRLAFGGRWLPKVRSGIPIRPCTRPVLEHLLHRHVTALSNVKVLSDCKVTGLTSQRRASGLSIVRNDKEETLDADLIVDAAGRSSPSVNWLSSAGAGQVEEEVVDGGVVYSSCTFQTKAPIEDDWMLLGLAPEVPSDPNAGAVMRIAPDKVLTAIVSYGKPKPPLSTEELVERMKTLSVKEPYQVVRDATPITDVKNYSRTENRFRHYGKLRSTVDGLVMLGDALCALNPRYGQGMTVAALSAEELGRQLDAYWSKHRSLDGFSAYFLSHMERILKLPWQMALMEDKLWVSAFSGKKPTAVERVLGRVTTRFLDSVFSNVDAYIRFMRVAHMLDSPAQLLTPKFIGSVLRGKGESAPPEGPGTTLQTSAT